MKFAVVPAHLYSTMNHVRKTQDNLTKLGNPRSGTGAEQCGSAVHLHLLHYLRLHAVKASVPQVSECFHLRELPWRDCHGSNILAAGGSCKKRAKTLSQRQRAQCKRMHRATHSASDILHTPHSQQVFLCCDALTHFAW